jgi:hypothetical protein
MWFLFWSACAGSAEDEPLPDRLSPLEENRAPAPAPVDGDPYPEALSVISGGDGSLWWAHARGYLHAPAQTVWEAISDPEVGVDRREVEEWSVTWDIAPQFERSYVVHNVVRDVLTVEYDLTWLHELQAGSEQAPERVVGVWEKTDGTAFIDLLAGSFVLTPVSAEVTEIALVEHLKAPLRDDATLVSYLRDLHESLVARVHGQSLPAY